MKSTWLGGTVQFSPLLQRLSSVSSQVTVFFSVLFFSFSFSHLLFHCSAVSSTFRHTLFLTVFALVRQEGEEICCLQVYLNKAINTEAVPLSKLQRGPGLSIIERGGRAANDHGGPTVPSQRVLQDPGHLTVSVRHIALTGNTLQYKGRT